MLVAVRRSLLAALLAVAVLGTVMDRATSAGLSDGTDAQVTGAAAAATPGSSDGTSGASAGDRSDDMTGGGDCTTSSPDTAAGYTEAFADLWGGWAGGDQASTVALPDGRILWLFGDTLLATPSATGTPTDVRMSHSSLLIQDAGCFEPVNGPGGGSVIPDPSADTWYWPQQAVVDGDRLWVTALRVRGDSGSLDFALQGVDLAEFALGAGGAPTFVAIHRTPASDAGDYGVLWGTGVAVSDGTAYLYGTRRAQEALVGRQLLLASVPVDRIADPSAWRFRTTKGWSARSDDATVLHPARGGVSTSLSAHETEAGWVLVTKRDEFVGDTVVALRARHPWGPFQEQELFDSPDAGPSLTYLPMAHPELRLRDGSLLVSINHNDTDFTTALTEPAALRPTFESVQLDG